MPSTDRRKREIYREMARLRAQMQALERELNRIELGIPEPWKRDKSFIPDFLKPRGVR